MKTSNHNSEWERKIVWELNNEHERICLTHKVNLRPIAIMLFDSETRWGQFDGLTRTISISQKLVKNHPWHQVVGVLRHEMAHQLVAESAYGGDRPGRSHDEEFKSACKRLCIPEQFARAGIDLQGGAIDWRTEKRDDKTEQILEKVRKLLALAGSSNEHEALLAMERVRELYAKYNLESVKAEGGSGFVHAVISLGKLKIQSWQQRIVGILLEHFFVKALTFHHYDPAIDGNTVAIELIGTRENVLMAEYVYHFLKNQLEYLVKEAGRLSGRKLGVRERNSYRLGVLSGFHTKLKDAEVAATTKTTHNYSSGLTVVGQAIAKFKKDDRLGDYISDMNPNLRVRKSARTTVDVNAFHSGQKIGREMNLSQPLESKMGNLGKALN